MCTNMTSNSILVFTIFTLLVQKYAIGSLIGKYGLKDRVEK